MFGTRQTGPSGPRWGTATHVEGGDFQGGVGLSRCPALGLPPSSPAALAGTADEPQKSKGLWGSFKAAVKRVKHQVLALHYANQDPRTGFLPRVLIVLALAYALSPLDLIPDFIPVLGLVDDLLILPGLIMLAVWLIPEDVMQDARRRAELEPLRLHQAWGMALLVFALWDAPLLAAAWWACDHYGGDSVQHNRVWVVVAAGALLVAAEAAWLLVEHRKDDRRRAGSAQQGGAEQAGLQEPLLDAAAPAGSATLAAQDLLDP